MRREWRASRNGIEVRAIADIAVVVTCHAPYLRWVADGCRSIVRQQPAAAEWVVVCDSCSPPGAIAHERILTGTWHDPSAARNAGLAATTAEWVVFLDADNVLPDGYLAGVERAALAAEPNVGVLYPDLQHCDEDLHPRRTQAMPRWDYWRMRAENCVDTASAWRREAIDVVGGWPTQDYGAHEDYALALAITAAGWRATRLPGPPVAKREHPAGRMRRRLSEGRVLNDLWRVRSLGIVSLLAGRKELLGQWEHSLLRMELPPRTALYVVDNGGDRDFTRRAHDVCVRLAERLSLAHLDFAAGGNPYRPAVGEGYMTRSRHLHVARLYSQVLPRVREDLVLTLEDDIEAPADAVRRLGEEIGYPARANVGAVASAYPQPLAAYLVCAGLGPGGWGRSPGWNEVPFESMDVSCVGGGCTIWANWALRQCAVQLQWEHLNLGWDGSVCTQLQRLGYRVRLHGGVRSEHHVAARSPRADGPPPADVRPRAAPPPRLEVPAR